jgi:hypothetical protein
MGSILWIDTVDNGSNDEAHAVAVDLLGNIVITGYSEIGGIYRYFTVKYDPEGSVLWTDTFGYHAGAEGVAIDPSGEYIAVTGITGSLGASSYLTVKYDSAGNVLWVDTLGKAPCWEYWAKDVAIDIVGNVVVTGTLCWGLSTEYDGLTVKYDRNGSILWLDTLCGPTQYHQEYAFGVAVDTARNIVVTGFIADPHSLNDDILVVKYDAEGSILWADTFDYTWSDCSYDVAISDPGDIFITGHYLLADSIYNANYITCKYERVQKSEEGRSHKNLVRHWNTPNPCTHGTHIKYQVPDTGERNADVYLGIYTTDGRMTRRLVNRKQQAGCFTVSWDGRDENGEKVPGGIYFYKLKMSEYQSTGKIILVR